MHAHPRRPVVVTIVAAVVASALSATLAPGAHAAPTAGALDMDAGGPAPAITDADAREGAFAAIVRDDEGRPHFVEVSAPTVAEAKRRAAAVPGAEGIAVDAPMHMTGTAEPLRSLQWAHDELEVDALPTTDTGGIVVAVVDSGVRATHQDFAPGQVRCLPGSNFVGDGVATACTDADGHGTHVAGIIAAVKNGKGISGIAPGTTILPVRVFGTSGATDAFTVARAIVWAADQGATVINASLGGAFSTALDEAVAHATSKGALVVASAGNNRRTGNATSWPASSPGALSVASTTRTGETSDFSHTGPTVDVAAPGSQILSLGITGDSAYESMSGTSMASPYAAGVATLVKAKHPAFTPTELTAALVTTAIDIEAVGRDDASGAGLVNPYTLLTGLPPRPRGVLQAPATPQELTASPGDAQVTLEWTPVTYTARAPVDFYRVYRDGVSTPVGTVAGAVFVDHHVSNGTAYQYSVSAVGRGGESARSAVVTSTPLAPLPRGGTGVAPPAPASPVVAPAKPVLKPVPTKVAPGQRIPVAGKDYRPASVLTVTQTYQVRQRIAVRQPVTAPVARRVTVQGTAVVKQLPVGTGYRTVQVDRLVPRTTRLAELRVGADGAVAGSVLPVKGVAGGILTLTGVDRSGRPVVVRSAVRVG